MPLDPQIADGSRPHRDSGLVPLQTATDEIIQATTRPPGGSFGSPVNLSGARAETPSNRSVATASDGTTTAVWRRSNGANFIAQAATRRTGRLLRYSCRTCRLPGQSANGVPGCRRPRRYCDRGLVSLSKASLSSFRPPPRPPGGIVRQSAVDLSDAQCRMRLDPQIGDRPRRHHHSGLVPLGWRQTTLSRLPPVRPAARSGPRSTSRSAGQAHSFLRLPTAADGTTTAVWYRFDLSANLIMPVDIDRAAVAAPAGEPRRAPEPERSLRPRPGSTADSTAPRTTSRSRM